MLPESIQKLISLFNKLPGIGPKTAERFVFYLLKQSPEERRNLADGILHLKDQLGYCQQCFQITSKNPCPICQDLRRDRSMICVVAENPDLIAIEKTGDFPGLYHVLGGTINHLEGAGPERLTIEPLLVRIKNNGVKEVIIATNPDIEGESTAMYLYKLLKPLNIKITRIGRGLPMGADLEYADEVTLQNAMQSRREM